MEEPHSIANGRVAPSYWLENEKARNKGVWGPKVLTHTKGAGEINTKLLKITYSEEMQEPVTKRHLCHPSTQKQRGTRHHKEWICREIPKRSDGFAQPTFKRVEWDHLHIVRIRANS